MKIPERLLKCEKKLLYLRIFCFHLVIIFLLYFSELTTTLINESRVLIKDAYFLTRVDDPKERFVKVLDKLNQSREEFGKEAILRNVELPNKPIIKFIVLPPNKTTFSNFSQRYLNPILVIPGNQGLGDELINPINILNRSSYVLVPILPGLYPNTDESLIVKDETLWEAFLNISKEFNLDPTKTSIIAQSRGVHEGLKFVEFANNNHVNLNHITLVTPAYNPFEQIIYTAFKKEISKEMISFLQRFFPELDVDLQEQLKHLPKEIRLTVFLNLLDQIAKPDTLEKIFINSGKNVEILYVEKGHNYLAERLISLSIAFNGQYGDFKLSELMEKEFPYLTNIEGGQIDLKEANSFQRFLKQLNIEWFLQDKIFKVVVVDKENQQNYIIWEKDKQPQTPCQKITLTKSQTSFLGLEKEFCY
jgi:hypothetical protein